MCVCERGPVEGGIGCSAVLRSVSAAAMSWEAEIMESQVMWEPDTKRNTHMDRFRAAVASSCGLRLGERRAGGWVGSPWPGSASPEPPRVGGCAPSGPGCGRDALRCPATRPRAPHPGGGS